jgi:hypothetical protein
VNGFSSVGGGVKGRDAKFEGGMMCVSYVIAACDELQTRFTKDKMHALNLPVPKTSQ